MSERLRFGILCNGRSFAAWQARAIEMLVRSGHAVPALLITDESPALQPAAKQSSLFARLGRLLRGKNQLWRLYSGLREPAALRPVDLSSLLQGIPELRCSVQKRGRFAQYFSGDDLDAIRAHDLDFILRFGFGILKGGILEAARYGVWSFHHDDETKYRGGPPAFWEIFKGDPITGAIFQRLTDKLDAGVVLRRGYFRTIDYSYSRNLNRVLMDSAEWPAAAASAVRQGALDIAAIEPSTTNAPIYFAPSNLTMLRYFATLARNIVRKIAQRFQREEWNVGAVRLSPQEALRGGPVRNVEWYPGVDGGWLADPIAYADNGVVHLLCERMRLQTEKGYIAHVSLNGTGWKPEYEVLDTGCHASYPYLFRYNGELYCVPETCEANEVRAYKCVAFPDRWQYAATLLRDFPAVDSTIFEYDGLWWLFCTSAEASAHRLSCFYAGSPFDAWTPHAQNPVKIDVRGSRPAGPPFWHDGALYRPAQDSSRTYGGRIALNRILELTPLRFAEETVAYLEPESRGPYNKALHTLNFIGDRAIIDGKRQRWKKTKS